MIELLEYDFFLNAIYISILASILCGVLGTFIVVKRLVFISGGISHAAFGGIGAFYYWGLNPLTGGFLVAGLLAIILGLSNRDKLINQGALIGVLWAFGMAVGILFIAKSPGYIPNLMTYMFGNILAVSADDLMVAVSLVIIVIGTIVMFYKEFVAISFDEEFAFIQGVPVRALMIVFMLLISISIVLLIRMVGVILVIALLTIPPMVSLMHVKRFLIVIIMSTVIGIIMTTGGLYLSYLFDLPSGPVIITVGTMALILSYAGKIISRKMEKLV